jgi:hypothetical protein
MMKMMGAASGSLNEVSFPEENVTETLSTWTSRDPGDPKQFTTLLAGWLLGIVANNWARFVVCQGVSVISCMPVERDIGTDHRGFHAGHLLLARSWGPGESIANPTET